MSERAVVAYVPVLHDGYRRFLERHGRDRPLYVVGRELYADYRPLAKDIRCLDPRLVAQAIASWGICSEVEVLTPAIAERLAAAGASITLPAEDVSHQLVERFFSRCEVRYASAFLRWDRTKTVQMLEPRPVERITAAEAFGELRLAAESAARESVDWWRQVGAAIRFASGELRAFHNVHHPDRLSAYVVGDPRANFFKGVSLDLSTAEHAEARLIADAAREGIATAGAVMYVTDFPCPPCAKLIAGAGVSRLIFREGYAVLDGQDVLDAAGVEVVQAA
jgi:dCMP deaminase